MLSNQNVAFVLIVVFRPKSRVGLWSPVDDVKVEKEEEERKEMDNF